MLTKLSMLLTAVAVAAIHHLPRKVRKHKTAIHMLCISVIGLSLFEEGGKMADWMFLILAIVVEAD